MYHTYCLRVEMTDEELQDRYRVTFSEVPQESEDRNNPENRFFFFFNPKVKCDIYGCAARCVSKVYHSTEGLQS